MHTKWLRCRGVSVVALVACMSSLALASCGGTIKLLTWTQVPSANPGTGDNVLRGVAAVNNADLWAVGSYQPTTASPNQTLIEFGHASTNGFTWAPVPSANSGAGDNVLSGVAAVDATDVWAVGSYLPTVNTVNHRTLTEIWNGISWTQVPSVDPGTGDNVLRGVVAVSAIDLWAVGSYQPTAASSVQTLIEHWDGAAWTQVPSANPGPSEDVLTGVAAVSASDVWAVGYYQPTATSPDQTLTEHWDGGAWTQVPSASPGTGRNVLNGVAAVSATDLWAVGSYQPTVNPTSTSPDQTLTEHGNGSSWTPAPSANPGTGRDVLTGVAAVDATAVWAVGYYNVTPTSPSKTLIEYWNGSSWTQVRSANPLLGSVGASLSGVAVISATDVWAVGSYRPTTPPSRTLTEQWA